MGELSVEVLEARAAALVKSEDLQFEDLEAYARDAEALGPLLDRAELSRLMVAFSSVQRRIAVERDGLRERLSAAGSGRKALRGYGSSLRSSARMCQRASSLA